MKKTFIYILFGLALLPQVSSAATKTQTASIKDSVKSISFDKGFLGNVNKEVSVLVEKIEVFRKAQKENFQTSLSKVDARRASEKDAKPALKALTFIHIILLAAILFVFSIQFVFYIACILVAFWILRKIFNFIRNLFRRRD